MTQTGLIAARTDPATRSVLYRVLADSFTFPTADFFEAVKSRQYYEMLLAVTTDAMPCSSCESTVRALEEKLGGFHGEFDEFCTEYIRLFDVSVGPGKPPCSLYGGEYVSRPRLDVMEELIRFYRFFDLAPSEQNRELPDHLSVELEFLHYLAFRESRALEAGADPSTFRRAQADFIERHPGNWVPQMRARLAAQMPLPFFDGLVAATSATLRADCEHLRAYLPSV